MEQTKTAPLEEHAVVIHVEKGTARHARVVEAQANASPNEITVNISKRHKLPAIPVLGVVIN
ncbi:hypothetical protein [Massilia horti]|uniref:Uncharacterized protein n=1 Tax=Massilia horti TaxID=2562153 RepID=A0A4Y9T682_9BURK|nr:hypothetical protein [Massilia horti]TFW33645.1 hypothetical protein E4O92_06535 [Massilia horti]